MSDDITEVEIYNDIFVTTDGAPVIALEGYDNNANFMFAGNNYYSSGDTFIIDNAGTIYHSLEAWRAGTGQETINGQPVGLNVSPLFVDPTGRLSAASCRLQSGSPLTNNGLDLTVLGLDPGLHDFEGNSLPQVQKYDVGAFEREGPLTRGQVTAFVTNGSPPGDNGDTLGTFIELQVEPVPAETWSAVQWQDTAGAWHDVEGWRDPLEAGGYRRWWVAPKDFGTGPFRWAISEGPDGQPLVTSPSFNLTGEAKQAVRVELALEW